MGADQRQATARLWSAIEGRREELVTLVADLVRRPSPLGREAEAQGYVADHLRGSGLAVESWDLDEALRTTPEGGDSGVPFAGRPNVAGVARGAGGGRALILNGHAADEWLDLDSLVPTAKALGGLLLEWCGVAG